MKNIILSDREFNILIEMLDTYEADNDCFDVEYDFKLKKKVSRPGTDLLFNGNGPEYSELISKLYSYY